MLPIPSDEQEEILSAFCEGYNIKIEAVAGSGKTTTLLHIAQTASKLFPLSYVLLLTYNRSLKDEIINRVKSLNLDCYCHVYTYHGYASKIFKTLINDDIKLKAVLNQNVIPIPTNYGIILLDEVQDMSPDYYYLIQRILSHGKVLVLVGDCRQCINEYKGATIEYLMNYSKYFDTGRPWKELKLRTSYRMTSKIANFINEHILHEELIKPGNRKNKDIFPIYSFGSYDIKHLVTAAVRDYGPDNVAILMPSIKSSSNPKSPISRLISSSNGIIYHLNDSINNDTSISDTGNKVLITTYNSMKGNERDCIILLGFDESYFKYYDKKWIDTESVPNLLYVAVTRAKELLIIVNDEKEKPLRTINSALLTTTCDVHGGIGESKLEIIRNKSRFTVTELICHRHPDDVNELLELMQIEPVQNSQNPLPYNNKIQFEGYFEDVAKYYGTLIPLLAQFKLTGITKLPFDVGNNKNSNISDLTTRFNILNKQGTKSIKDWMEYVVIYTALESCYYFLARQISNYDWIDIEFINIQVERIVSLLKNKSGEFEDSYSIDKPYRLDGSFDYCDGNEIWEFKCTRNLNNEHKIQCGAHVMLYYMNKGKILPCILYNTRTEEMLRITVTDPIKYLNILMKHKIDLIIQLDNLKINE